MTFLRNSLVAGASWSIQHARSFFFRPKFEANYRALHFPGASDGRPTRSRTRPADISAARIDQSGAVAEGPVALRRKRRDLGAGRVPRSRPHADEEIESRVPSAERVRDRGVVSRVLITARSPPSRA